MQLSIIIVNYNVKYFLEQCLCSVQKAVQGLEAEIIVVDNASNDGSKEYLQPKFPAVHFIWSEANNGFAKANNMALKQAKGEFILFLNPDTIVAEDSFINCISFFKQTSNAGAIGVRMIDGSGTFLPESKRAFPSAKVSFFKLSGLSTLFPYSKLFARYNLGHLNEKETHQVEVLSGAFMMIRKQVLDVTGGFDEDFFMYGEDIDLSYRMNNLTIRQQQFQNYYLGTQTIIHFKGESTQKHSAKYVQQFYKAMLQFVNKHPQEFHNVFFKLVLKTGIVARAFFSFLKRSTPATSHPQRKQRLLIAASEQKALQLQAFLSEFQYNGFAENAISTDGVDAFLFCEDENHSFKNIIAQTEQYGSACSIYIHASQSSSIVGSSSKNSSGIAIALNLKKDVCSPAS